MFTISLVEMRPKILHIIDRATEQTKPARVKTKLLYDGIKSLDEGVVFLCTYPYNISSSGTLILHRSHDIVTSFLCGRVFVVNNVIY